MRNRISRYCAPRIINPRPQDDCQRLRLKGRMRRRSTVVAEPSKVSFPLRWFGQFRLVRTQHRLGATTRSLRCLSMTNAFSVPSWSTTSSWSTWKSKVIGARSFSRSWTTRSSGVEIWDTEWAGRRITLRSASGKIEIVLRLELPDRLVVERGHFNANGVQIRVHPNGRVDLGGTGNISNGCQSEDVDAMFALGTCSVASASYRQVDPPRHH